MRLDSINLSPEATLGLALLVGVLGTARFVRLIVADEYPPVVWLRMKWGAITHDGPWSLVLNCPWCFAPYATAANLAIAWFTHLHPAWWITNLWLAASYASAWVVYHDEDGA